MLSSYNTVKPCQKCLIHHTALGVKWAIRGTNFCNVHGGQLPEITKVAEQAVQGARDRLVLQAEIQYDGDMAKEPSTDQISRKLAIEQIETKIEEWKETMDNLSYSPDGYDPTHEQGILLGLEQARDILKDL